MREEQLKKNIDQLRSRSMITNKERGTVMAFKCRKCKTEKTIKEYGTDVHNLCEDCTDLFHLWLGE